MAHSGDNAKSAQGTNGSVLEHEFGPTPQSYFSTSYPHPIADSTETHFRYKAYDNLPKTLMDKLKRLENEEMNDRCPRYVMNLTMFTPDQKPAWNSSNGRDDPSQLWFLYKWIKTKRGGPDSEWNFTPTQVRLQSSPACHPALALRVDDFPKTDLHKLSCVSFGRPRGSSPDCFFLRTTDSNGIWEYRWTGLPPACEMAVQSHFRSGEGNEWVGGRLRAVEFGWDGSWVVYGSGNNYDWWLSPTHYDEELGYALQIGKERGWSINKVSLNLRNPKEYVLAFNNEKADVYAALHRTFMPKFEKVVKEWAAGKGLTANLHAVRLDDADCDFVTPPPTPPPSIAGTRNLNHTSTGGMLSEEHLSNEDDLAELEPSPSRTRHSRTNSHQVTQQSRHRINSTDSSIVGYTQPRNNTTYIKPATQQQIIGPPPGMVELQGNMPLHIHHHPSEEVTCSLCKAGYFPYRFSPNTVATESNRAMEGTHAKKRGKKLFGFQVTRADG